MRWKENRRMDILEVKESFKEEGEIHYVKCHR